LYALTINVIKIPYKPKQQKSSGLSL